MSYIVIEIQTLANGTVATLSTVYNDGLEAESRFHAILSAAAISELPVHAAVIMTNGGQFIDGKTYRHNEPED